MKKIKVFFTLMVLVLLTWPVFSQQEIEEVNNLTPSDTSEWIIELADPVLPEYQERQGHFLPKQVYDLFSPKYLNQITWSGTALMRVNNLPGNPCRCGRTARFIYSSLTDKSIDLDWKGDWSHQTDPNDYLYIIDYKGEFIALWFENPKALHCKKLVLPNDDNYVRSETIEIPLFDQPVEWKWIFTGVGWDCSKYAKGEVITSSAQYGYTSVTTTWEGGEEYELPQANTRIIANGKIVYCE